VSQPTLDTTNEIRPKLGRSGYLRIVQVAVFILMLGLLLFLPAGRLDWPEAWIFLLGFVLVIVVAGIWSVRNNPDLINERGRVAENTKWWDKILLTLYTLSFFALMVSAGLNARYRWSSVPLGFKIAGGIGLILAFGLVFWVAKTNAYLSAVVRIQDDRGHQVVTDGPYCYVRHPMYAGMFFFECIPFLLGSWWALIPGGLMIVIFIIRTALEDKTLIAELPGYAEYAQRVRYRLLPGIW
jgi:protein-S-isoprenylcysteine O-methyltransferase Ste14